MVKNITPEIQGYAHQIVKNVFGTHVKVKGFEWAMGGLYNKLFKVNTTDGDFVLKMECDKIFFATRKNQIENELIGNRIFQKAGIPCANVIACDFTENDVGVRYICFEHINGDADLWGNQIDKYDEITKAEIARQYKEAVLKMRDMTTSHFGSLSPSGILGRHETYDGYYLSTLNLLIKDSEDYELFTDEELPIVKAAAAKPLIYSKTYTPTFVHYDLGYHNLIWGNTQGGEDKVYVVDFGNALYGLPYMEEIIFRIHGEDTDIYELLDLDRDLYNFENNLIFDFEKMFWTVTERLTEDYAYSWHAENIRKAKTDTSRTHITDLVDKCRKILS